MPAIFILLNMLLYTSNTVASDGDALILRAGDHSSYLRIVLEGPGEIISRANVNRKPGEIEIGFSGSEFEITAGKLPVTYKREKNLVIIGTNKKGEMKTFSLDNPSRLVIDVYRKKHVPAKSKAVVPMAETGEEISTGEAAGSNIKKQSGENAEIKDNTEQQADARIKSASEGKKAEEETAQTASSDRTVMTTKHEIRQSNAALKGYRKYDVDDSFIQDEYRAVWEVLKSGKSFAAIKELALLKPDNPESIAVYHFLYGEAYGNLEKHMTAINHLRLAYVYTSSRQLKELALFRRAGIYKKIGLLYEARADYIIFLRNYPSSVYAETAHLHMGQILSEMGEYHEAVKQYEQSGGVPDALFGMANAMQRTERIEEARNIYARAMKEDRDYIKESPETYYLIGENMRMAGEFEEAKTHLSGIKDGPYKYEAVIGLGLIAVKEEDISLAIKHFEAATQARDRNTRVKALFHLHDAFMKKGRIKEAISALEEIRRDHIDSIMYKRALMELAKIYRQQDRLEDSVALLKELVYAKEPPMEAFSELETILVEASEKKKKDPGSTELAELWREVGQWMLDGSREEFLLKITKNMKHEGRAFLDLCTWLMENASGRTRSIAALNLADYFAGIKELNVSARYLEVARYSDEFRDDVTRIEAKILYLSGDADSALNKLASLEEFRGNDFRVLGNIIYDLKKTKKEKAREATALYENKLNGRTREAEDYIRLADMLLEDNEVNRALGYYRMAYRKNPDDEWTVYRLGYGESMPVSKEMYDRLQQGDSMINRLAKTRLMEIDLLNKVDEVY